MERVAGPLLRPSSSGSIWSSSNTRNEVVGTLVVGTTIDGSGFSSISKRETAARIGPAGRGPVPMRKDLLFLFPSRWDGTEVLGYPRSGSSRIRIPRAVFPYHVRFSLLFRSRIFFLRPRGITHGFYGPYASCYCCCATPEPTTPGSVKANSIASEALLSVGPTRTSTKLAFLLVPSDVISVIAPVQSVLTV